MAEKEPQAVGAIQRTIRIILLVLMVLSFFLAQSSIWVHHIVFNQQSFTERTTSVLTSQQSRDSIAETITDRVFADRPIADRLLGDRATNLISSFLGSDLSESTIRRVANTSYAYFTSSNREDIAINLSAIRDPLAGIVAFAESRGRDVTFDANRIPSEIVLVKNNELPNLSHYIQLLMFTGALLWIIAIGSALGYIFIARPQRIRRMYVVLGLLAATCGIALFTGPFIPPAVATFVNAIPMRDVASRLATAFLEPFGKQLAITLLILGAGALVLRFRWVFARIWHKSVAAVKPTAKKPTKK